MSQRTRFLLVLILLAALSRVIPHPANFTPITAVALFGAARLANRWCAFLVPLAAMLISDLALDVVVRLDVYPDWMAQTRGLHSGSWVIYATMLLVTVLGFTLRAKNSPLRIAGTTLGGSVVFFVVTNFAVWAGGDLYPATLDGLVQCYVAGIPFFGRSLASDFLYVGLLFGSFAWVENKYRLDGRVAAQTAA
jgi:hypothetical protein